MVKNAEAAQRIGALLALSSRIHFQLGPAAQAWFGEGPHSSGEAALLKNLVELGPKTVPELAAMRPTSRQFIQGLVDGMAAKGLVKFQDNPNHKRSKLVALTAKGRATGESLNTKRMAALDRIAQGCRDSDLQAAARALQAILEALERQSKP